MRPLCALLFLAALPWAAQAAEPVSENPPNTPAPSPVKETPPSPWVVPDLPSADIRLSWSDFRELLQLLQPPAGKQAEKPAPPPWPWAVTSAHYQLDATDGQSVRADVTFEVEVWADAWTTIPILGDAVALGSVQLDGKASVLRDESGWFTLLLNEPGHHQLEITFYARPVEKEGDVRLEMPVTPATEIAAWTFGMDVPAVDPDCYWVFSCGSRYSKPLDR